jgi:CxxC motif-containing protein (DUF1111 family)
MNSIRTLPLTLVTLACGLIGICLASGQVPNSPILPPPTLPFDNETNGFEDQAAFTQDREAFEEVETILKEKVCGKNESDGARSVSGKVPKAANDRPKTPICAEKETKGGLGPVYNATSCVSCHQNPVSGSSSQIAEIRAGHFGPNPDHPEQLAFVEHPGGSVVHQRSINPGIQEHILPEDANRTLRMSTNVLGDGFVECIADVDLILKAATQVSDKFGDLRGTIVLAPVAITADTSREHVGRFGWKSQHASLLNFSADAYLNEMGITSVLQPEENKPDGKPIPPGIDQIPDPEDPKDKDHPFGEDVEAFTRFMRSTKVPPRDTKALAQLSVIAGEKLFNDMGENGKKTGCAICHVPKWTTLPEGSAMDGNFPNNAVPAALGKKDIFPFSDFLLHDIGTGDGIVQTQHAQFPPTSAASIVPLTLDKLKPAPNSRGLDDELRKQAQELHIVHLLSSQSGDQKKADKRIEFDEKNNRRILSGDLADTAQMIRTAPLWGLRVRSQLLHDGSALTIDEAIRKHSGQAERVKLNYANVLTQEERNHLLAFLNSL